MKQLLLVAGLLVASGDFSRAQSKADGLGVVSGPPSAVLRSQFQETLGEKNGRVVLDVVEKSIASRAGIRQFDVLTHVAGNAVETSRSFVSCFKKQGATAVDVLRHGKRKRLTLVFPGVAKRGAAHAAANKIVVPNAENLLNYHCAFICKKQNEKKFAISVDLSCEYKDGTTSRQRFSGPAGAMSKRLNALPVTLKREIEPILVRLAQQAEAKPDAKPKPVRFRLQPRLSGEHQAVQVELAAPPKKAADTWRAYLMFQTFPEKKELHARDLLKVPSFSQELERLPRNARDIIKRTLEGTRPPLGKVQVRQRKP